MLEAPAVPYVTNTLTIMVPKDNPAHVTGLADLGKPGLRLAMPNPAFEGIARQIDAALKKAGGDALATAVYKTKVADGSTVLTHIHHRQTPLFLMQGLADAGVTWQSEAMFQEQAGHAITHVDIPAGQNSTAIYAGAMVKGAPHPEAAKLWLDFIHSGPALAIFGALRFQTICCRIRGRRELKGGVHDHHHIRQRGDRFRCRGFTDRGAAHLAYRRLGTAGHAVHPGPSSTGAAVRAASSTRPPSLTPGADTTGWRTSSRPQCRVPCSASTT